jgi:hypothetical protein
MADKGSDPFALWQKTIGEMEKQLNAFANEAMTSPEFSKLMNNAGGIATGTQKQFSDLMAKYLLMMNLPSRAQMVDLAERLQTIEGQVNDIKALLQHMQKSSGAPHSPPGVPRPPRTRRPPPAPPGERT